MEQGSFASRPFRPVRNVSAGVGRIHDDATAVGLGFRGGTVAGSVHMDLAAALLVEEYGKRWFERGALSLYFLNATTDGERVQAVCELPLDDRQVQVWLRRDDGLDVATGTASVDDHRASALRARDLRAVDPQRLRILRHLEPGARLGEWDATLEPDLQLERYRAGVISDPLSWYAESSPWGGPVAAPSTAVHLLWGVPMAALRPLLPDTRAVGLFGAIEVAHLAGPLRLGERYRVQADVVAVSDSPRTESLWFDSVALDRGEPVASMRMMLRFMKASSSLYDEGG